MKSSIACCFAAAAATVLFGADKEDSATVSLPSEFKVDNLIRVTGQPVRLQPSVQTLCLPATAKPIMEASCHKSPPLPISM
jgi:hypothetical protein